MGPVDPTVTAKALALARAARLRHEERTRRALHAQKKSKEWERKSRKRRVQ